MNISDIFYMFPPNEDNVVKVALHSMGYSNSQSSLSDPGVQVSVPRTGRFQGSLDEQIPKESVDELRANLARIWPELAKKPFSGTRMCWYCDTLDSKYCNSTLG